MSCYPVVQGIHQGKNKVAQNEKWKKQLWVFVYIKQGKFEAFRWNFSSSTISEIERSAPLLFFSSGWSSQLPPFFIHSVMALVIGWKLMSPISPLCLCHHLVSKSQQEFHSKKCDSVIANLNIPKICSSQSHCREVSVSNGARHN